jgi:rhodanese-related sulfurtransferase
MSALHGVSTPHPSGFREIGVDAAEANLGEFVLIDVREPDEFTGPLGHIANAKLVPLGTVPDVARGWDKTKTYLMICRSGGRSARAAAHLMHQGFAEVYNLEGGMMAWNEEAKDIVS